YLVPTIPFLYLGILHIFRSFASINRRTPVRIAFLAAFAVLLGANTASILSGLRDYIYEGRFARTNDVIATNIRREHRALVFEFTPLKTPLTRYYLPELSKNGVKSVVLEGVLASKFKFPRNIAWWCLSMAAIWLAPLFLERMRRMR